MKESETVLLSNALWQGKWWWAQTETPFPLNIRKHFSTMWEYYVSDQVLAEIAQTGCEVSILGDGQKTTAMVLGHWLYLAVLWAGDLDQTISRSPFQSQWFCDSVVPLRGPYSLISWHGLMSSLCSAIPSQAFLQLLCMWCWLHCCDLVCCVHIDSVVSYLFSDCISHVLTIGLYPELKAAWLPLEPPPPKKKNPRNWLADQAHLIRKLSQTKVLLILLLAEG